MNTTRTLTRRHRTGPLRAGSPSPALRRKLPSPLRSSFCSLSGGHPTGAGPDLPSSPFSAAAPPPFRLLCPIPLTPPPATPPPTPRARAAALDRPTAPPREVEPALPGRRAAPAPAASLSSSARPPPPPAPLQTRGGVALPAEGHGGPAATATGLPPAHLYVPIPLAEAASAHLTPPPTTDPKPLLGPSGLGPPARRRARHGIAASPLPQPPLPGTPASGGAAPDPLGYSERAHTAVAPPAAGVGAVAGVAGTVAALAAVTPGVEPLGRPLDPAAVPAARAEVLSLSALARDARNPRLLFRVEPQSSTGSRSATSCRRSSA